MNVTLKSISTQTTVIIPFFKDSANRDQYVTSIKNLQTKNSISQKIQQLQQTELSSPQFLTTTDQDQTTFVLYPLGELTKFNQRIFIVKTRGIVQFCKKNTLLEFDLVIEPMLQAIPEPIKGLQLAVEALVMADYSFDLYRNPEELELPELKCTSHIKELNVILNQAQEASYTEAFQKGLTIARYTNIARDLSNTPGGDMTPTILAQKAQEICAPLGINVSILNEDQMRELNMGGILGVSKGSAESATLIVLEYNLKADQKPIAFVGKGITFDTGGINLKPSQALGDMYMDMSGGAAVISAVAALANLNSSESVVGLIPAVENMPSGSSYRPGDMLKTMSGKIIEVGNTDAEGRIVLADALTYAHKYKPSTIIDVATLTGAAMVALGYRASAIMTRHAGLQEKLLNAAEQSGDYVWPLPLWDEYESEVEGKFGGFSNTGKFERVGGAITAGMFLYQFVKEYEKETSWAHVDIAPMMTSVEDQNLSPGASGAGVRLLVKLIEELS